jgi:hypothetical protein
MARGKLINSRNITCKTSSLPDLSASPRDKRKTASNSSAYSSRYLRGYNLRSKPYRRERNCRSTDIVDQPAEKDVCGKSSDLGVSLIASGTSIINASQAHVMIVCFASDSAREVLRGKGQSWLGTRIALPAAAMNMDKAKAPNNAQKRFLWLLSRK